jgi:UDPglucose 6-dehydrogenase
MNSSASEKLISKKYKRYLFSKFKILSSKFCFMNVAVIGTGYVGLVSGACLAELGHRVICVDVDPQKIEKLHQGIMPIYEPGLEEVVNRNVRLGRLSFTTDFSKAVPEASVISIAVGTPSAEDGSVDMSYVESAVRAIAPHVKDGSVVADKSTVPVGTAEQVEAWLRSLTSARVEVVSNPEFLREGFAVYDFLNPARVVIGSSSDHATDVMVHLYAYLDCPKLIMDRRSAELTKYAANAFLATKISFINEIAHLAEEVGADVEAVSKGIGSDPRIGKEFLRASLGWGGSCFPKDVRAIVHLADRYGHPMPIVRAAQVMNARARERVIERLERALGTLQGKRVGVLGIAFKQNTDDTRESPALDVIRSLRDRGAVVTAYDPIARLSDQDLVEGLLMHAADPYEAAKEAEAIVIATEWEEFRALDLDRLKAAMKGDLLMDARNLVRPDDAMQAGLKQMRVGKSFDEKKKE